MNAPDDANLGNVLHLFVVGKTDGEEQFVVVAAIEGAGRDVHVEVFGHRRRLIIQGDALFVHLTADVTLLADVKQLRREAVGNVNHRGGQDVGLLQQLDDVPPGLRLELSLQQIFLAGEIGLERHLRFVLTHLLFVYRLLAFQHLQAHIGCAQVARHTDEVSVLGATAINNPPLLGFAQTGQA